jgi:hypothetical protein
MLALGTHPTTDVVAYLGTHVVEVVELCTWFERLVMHAP